MINPNFDPTTTSKQEWRTHLKNIRQELPANRQEQASEHACHQLNDICQNSDFILSFASFGSEINLWSFNQELCQQGRLILPLMTEEKKLGLFQITHFNQLIPHHWGMLEPKPLECLQITISQIEVALIPGLGFDKTTHYRLGYGQGCYDRLLASAPTSTQTWGVGFLEQAVKGLPYSKEDIPMNHILLT